MKIRLSRYGQLELGFPTIAAIVVESEVKGRQYDVTPGTKEVEKGRTVTEYREVAKKRTATREGTETHYKKVPIFEYLLSRF